MRCKNTGNEMIKRDEWVKAGERDGKENEEKEGNRCAVLKGSIRRL